MGIYRAEDLGREQRCKDGSRTIIILFLKFIIASKTFVVSGEEG